MAHRNKTWLVVAMAASILGLTIGVSAGVVRKVQSQPIVLVTNPLPANPMAIPLQAAWEIAEAQARGWKTDAVLAQLASSDLDDDTANELSGVDGTRRSWQAIAISQASPSRQLRIRITDGVVTDARERFGDHPEAMQQRPSLDSTEALAAARETNPGFGPSTSSDQRGIHYVLQKLPEDSVPVIRVIGAVQREATFVDVDAQRGEVVGSKYRTYAPTGGVLFSADGGLTWFASSLTGLMVTSIAASPLEEGVAYASVAERYEIAVYRSRDGGATWSQTGRLPEAAGNWPYGIAVTRVPGQSGTTVLVGTRSGLWLSHDDGSRWVLAPGLPSGNAQRLAALDGLQGSRVFVSIVRNPQEAWLYSSRDLTDWRKESDGSLRLSLSADGASMFAVEGRAPRRGYVFAPDKSLELPLPDDLQSSVLRAAGRLDGSSPIIGESSGSIYLSLDKGATWQTTLDRVSLSSLAAAPSFAASGVALAGGRSGIFRTTDWGQHWQRVLARPSTIVPGIGDIIAIAFLSDMQAVSVNGGSITWQEDR